MNEPALVSIIIVNWNGLHWLPDCFDSLSKQNYKNYELILVDNASKDASVDWVKTNYPKTKIIVNKLNMGFAIANNIGYKSSKGKYILFLNNDTRASTTFLTELIKTLESDMRIGGVQSKILLMGKTDIHDSIGAFLTPTGFLYHYGFAQQDQPKYDKELDLYTAKGACMMFRKDVLYSVAVDGNIFNPYFFAYFEETDLCHRIWLAGYRIVYVYKSVIYHKMGATSSSLDSTFVQYHSFKNRIAAYFINLDMRHLLEILPLHLLYIQMYALSLLFKGNVGLYVAIQNALWWNIVNLRNLLRLRHIVQKQIRRVPDAVFWHTIFRKPSFAYYLALSRGRLNYEKNLF